MAAGHQSSFRIIPGAQNIPNLHELVLNVVTSCIMPLYIYKLQLPLYTEPPLHAIFP